MIKYAIYTDFAKSAVGWEMSSSLQTTGWRPSVADWGCGMSAGCTLGPIVCWCQQCIAT